ncbi:MAG TPA: phosphotransferase [Trebonia sp.]|nr:phosphotransferase [Trebonia sp.]
MEFTDIKAPDPVDGIPPWRDERWVAEAEDWIGAECARAGLARTGPALGRARVYSVVARVPVSGGTVWFKASPPAASFEPSLLLALAGWDPGRFAAPIAVDVDRAWSLTRDGGPTLRERHSRPGDVAAWRVMLSAYGRLQFGLARHVGDLLTLGLADLRPVSVPDRFDRLLADPATEQMVDAHGGISRAQHQALHALAPRLREWCAELVDLAIPASLDHADVHPNNVFAATGTPFDWGDAAVAHPFSSLLVALRTAAEQAGLPPRAPELTALTEDYSRPWLDAGHRRAAVDRSLYLGLRIAPLARSLTWGRMFPCYLGHPGPVGHAARALAAVLDQDPLGPRE